MNGVSQEDRSSPIDEGDLINPSLGVKDAAALGMPTSFAYRQVNSRRRILMQTVLLIVLGAALGSTARYYLAQWAAQRFGTVFPYGTLIINITGSFLLGLIYTVLLRTSPSYAPLLRAFLGIGLLGGYTTFSSFSYETSQLLLEGNLTGAVINPLLSVVGGILLCILGIALGNVLTAG
jgi:fluoride exporter